EDDAAEHGRSAETTRRALRVLGGELGATGETVGVVLGHDVRVVPSEPDLWPGMCCLQFGATGSWVVLAGDRRRRGDGTTVGAADHPGQRAWQSPTVDLGRSLRIRALRDQNAPRLDVAGRRGAPPEVRSGGTGRVRCSAPAANRARA